MIWLLGVFFMFGILKELDVRLGKVVELILEIDW